MKVFNSILLLSIGLLLTNCDKEDQPKKIIPVGGLYSLTGNWSSLGKASQSAINLALVDVNKYLEERGSAYQFSTVISDTRLDTTSAKESIQNAVERNSIRIFIGPQSSAELKAVKKYADENELLVISQGSTANTLAIAGDGIFRFCPGDGPEALAMSRVMYAAGKRVIISLARNDAGNIGLQNSVGTSFSALGGTVDAITPYATNLTNYTSILAELKSKIQTYSTSQGADKVGIYIASFDECKDLFSQASTDPVFSSVKWYGGDGVVGSSELISNVAARNFAITTGFIAPNFGLPADPHPDLETIAAAIKSGSGEEPDAYALSVYDAMWVIGLTFANYPGVLNDYAKLKSAFAAQAEQYYGITGPTILNDNGDRAISSFEYWAIVNEAGQYKWKVVGAD